MNDFTQEIIRIIKSIPKGKVLTYGLVAELAGDPRAARQISWTLHALSEKYDLPWHRIVNSKGTIANPSLEGKEHQKSLLEQEGIKVSDRYEIDLRQYLWEVDWQDLEHQAESKKDR